MKPETRFALRVDAKLKKLPKSHWYNIQQMAIRGTPDRIGLVNGKFVALELKKDAKAKATRLQHYQLARIRRAGGYAVILYPENLDQVMDELYEL